MQIHNTGPLWILIGALAFGTLGTAQALAPAEATPYVIGTIRMFGGGIVLLTICAFRNLLPTRHGWWRIETLLCIVGLVGFQVCFFEGIRQVGVAIGTISTGGITPIATGLMCRIFLGEHLSIRWFIFTPLALLGLMLLTMTGGTSIESMQGLMLTSASGLFYALYITASKRLVANHHPIAFTMVVSLGAGLCLLTLALTHPLAWVATLHGLAISIHFSVITVAFAFSALSKGLQTTSAPVTATLLLAEPLSAALLGIFLLGEAISTWAGLGLVCIFLAIIGLAWPVSPKKLTNFTNKM